jgi:hypothetical protein
VNPAVRTERTFEEIRVGQLSTALGSAEPGLRGLQSWLDELQPCVGAQVAELHWSAQGAAGPTARAESTVTRWRVAENSTGVIHSDLRLSSPTGEPSERAQVVWHVPAVSAPADPLTRTARDFGSLAWAQLLAERLTGDPRFAAATGSFDGSIALAVGPDEVDLRIYRGTIIEVARKSLLGATFTITASELTWVELLTGPYDDFVRFAARSAFRIRGSGFEYLRMTKAVRILVSHARELAGSDDDA